MKRRFMIALHIQVRIVFFDLFQIPGIHLGQGQPGMHKTPDGELQLEFLERFPQGSDLLPFPLAVRAGSGQVAIFSPLPEPRSAKGLNLLNLATSSRSL